jgi:hypothetical protein
MNGLLVALSDRRDLRDGTARPPPDIRGRFGTARTDIDRPR